MLTAAEIKEVKSLSQKKFRDSSGLFVVEGEKMVEEALRSGFSLYRLYREEEIGKAAMARMTGLSSTSQALAVLHQRPLPSKLEIPARGLFLALDGIRDPGNLGTILRIADWFGADAVYCSPDTVELYNPKVVQASMGAIFRVKVFQADLPSFCREVRASGGYVYGTFLDGENLYSRPIETGNGAASVIVTGNESRGISKEVAACVSDRLYIPPYPADDPGSESLNAAIATAVTLAEFRRRSAL